MGVSTLIRLIEYPGPISPAAELNIPYKFFNEVDLVAKISDISTGANQVDYALTADYTLAGVGGDSATLTVVTAVTAAQKLTIYRESALTRSVDYIEGGKLSPDVLDTDIDRLLLIIQELKQDLGRSITQSITAPANDDLALPASQDGFHLGWSGTSLANFAPEPAPSDLAVGDYFAVASGVPKEFFDLTFSVSTKDDLTVIRNGSHLQEEGTAATSDFEIISPTQIKISNPVPGTTANEKLSFRPRGVFNQSVALEDLGVAGAGLGPTLKRPDGTNKVFSIDNSDQLLIGGVPSVPTAIPSGTKMLFRQTAAPTGWTKDTTHDNKALRVVSGTITTGGVNNFTTALGAAVGISGTTDTHVLTVAEIPAHTHGTKVENGSGGSESTQTLDGDLGNDTSGSTGGGGGHTHGLTAATANINVQYVDVIIATKD